MGLRQLGRGRPGVPCLLSLAGGVGKTSLVAKLLGALLEGGGGGRWAGAVGLCPMPTIPPQRAKALVWDPILATIKLSRRWGTADSESKCNGFDFTGIEFDEVERAFWEEEFCGCFPSQALSRAGVEPPGDIVELVLGEDAEVGSFRQILPEQPVGVFADAALPRRMGWAK